MYGKMEAESVSVTAGAKQPGSEWSCEGRGPHRSLDFLLRIMGANG